MEMGVLFQDDISWLIIKNCMFLRWTGCVCAMLPHLCCTSTFRCRSSQAIPHPATKCEANPKHICCENQYCRPTKVASLHDPSHMSPCHCPCTCLNSLSDIHILSCYTFFLRTITMPASGFRNLQCWPPSCWGICGPACFVLHMLRSLLHHRK